MTSTPVRLMLMLAVAGIGANAGHAADVVPLPGTAPLHAAGDMTERVIDGAVGFMSMQVRRAAGSRSSLWKPDYSSPQAYEASVEPNRKRFRSYIGVADPRVTVDDLQMVATFSQPALAAETDRFSIYSVRWPVLAGVDAEGLLIEPKGRVVAQVIVLPDANESPESVAGLEAGISGRRQAARRLAESGCRVLVPTLIDRSSQWSGQPDGIRSQNLSHREFIYLFAYPLGRHIIGYEVQRVLAAVDYFKSRDATLPIGVTGYGEGGLIAFYAAAVDTRIDAAYVSGYFQEREALSQEPNYRNVWGILHEFGDAGIAALVAPRGFVVEAARGPEGPGRPASTSSPEKKHGRLTSPGIESVRAEFERAAGHYRRLGATEKSALALSGDGQGEPYTDQALAFFLRRLGAGDLAAVPDNVLRDQRSRFEPATRLRRQFEQLLAHTQEVMRMSPLRRSEFWGKKDALAPLSRNNFQDPTVLRSRQTLCHRTVGGPDTRVPAVFLGGGVGTLAGSEFASWCAVSANSG